MAFWIIVINLSSVSSAFSVQGTPTFSTALVLPKTSFSLPKAYVGDRESAEKKMATTPIRDKSQIIFFIF
jgi:hypothetical protein